MTRRSLALVPLLLALAGCGGSTNGVPTVQAAKVYALTGFEPSAPVQAGRPSLVSFIIRQPDGTPMTRFKTGPGPHTGVHLILVRHDLAYLIHKHPQVGAGGKIAQKVTFPAPGLYRVVLDVYPATGVQPNFQLFARVRVAGTFTPKPLPRAGGAVSVGGDRFTLRGGAGLKALQAQVVTVTVTDARGHTATFTPWYGALAHAIFFRAGSLDYFHTHVCSPGATGCTSFLGGARVTGVSTTPGRLKVGVLLPAPGTWRLFLQSRIDGRLVTAPFTLHVT